MKFNEAIEKYKTFYGLKIKAKSLSGYELDLRQFCLYMHNPDIEEIKDEHITSYLNEQRGFNLHAPPFKRTQITAYSQSSFLTTS